MLYIGADHRGFAMKEAVKSWFLEHGEAMSDVGAHELDVADDYPDFAIEAAKLVSQNPEDTKAILICGSGHGMDMVANKYKGVRAAIGFNISVAKQSREHENANVLVLPSDWLHESEAIEIASVWLSTEYSKAERNERRLGEMMEVEDKNFK